MLLRINSSKMNFFEIGILHCNKNVIDVSIVQEFDKFSNFFGDLFREKRLSWVLGDSYYNK